MKKKAAKGKVKTGRKRSGVKDLSAKKASAVKGGLLPAVYPVSYKVLDSSLKNIGTLGYKIK